MMGSYSLPNPSLLLHIDNLGCTRVPGDLLSSVLKVIMYFPQRINTLLSMLFTK